MTRYFFHTEDGVRTVDKVGTELSGVHAAQAEAIRYMAETLKEQPSHLWRDPVWRLTVTDEQNLTLFIIEVNVTIAPAMGAQAQKAFEGLDTPES